MQKPKVLIVNDHPASLLALGSLLERPAGDGDYEVISARSGEEALRQVLKHEFAVILLDISMPGMDGFETAEAIHSHPRSASIPIIFITAQFADEMHRLKGYQKGAVDYLFVPVIPQILQTKVSVFVDLARKNLQLQNKTEELAEVNRTLQVQRMRDLQHIAERQAAEEALRQSREELRMLASHLEQIKEDERKRIAREIHDELGQNLLALRLDISMLYERTGKSHPRLNAKVYNVLAQIDTTMKSMRAIINNLRPSVLDLGLNAAIEWQVQEFQRRSGIACRLTMDKQDLNLDDKRATALFRTLQESLNNVIRHAQANRVEIDLHQKDDLVILRVADNGIGTYPGCRRKSNSFGLIGIKERVSSLGGQLTINTGHDKGMSLTISIPVADGGTETPQEGDHDVITFNSVTGKQRTGKNETVVKGPFDMRRKKSNVRQTQ
ncbi:MAG TPA: response regulator [Paucimonas sp.]|nr:response regulator [Paucimonas sp.]